jgi:hypothetical protein
MKLRRMAGYLCIEGDGMVHMEDALPHLAGLHVGDDGVVDGSLLHRLGQVALYRHREALDIFPAEHSVPAQLLATSFGQGDGT